MWREADQQRMRDYMRELREMKARVSERPYLFEQVKQVRNAWTLLRALGDISSGI